MRHRDWVIRGIITMSTIGEIQHLHHQQIRVFQKERSIPFNVINLRPIASQTLPDPSLGTAQGGTIPNDASNPDHTRSPFFELQLGVDPEISLFEGQQVSIIITLPDKTLWDRAWLWGLRIWQQRSTDS